MTSSKALARALFYFMKQRRISVSSTLGFEEDRYQLLAIFGIIISDSREPDARVTQAHSASSTSNEKAPVLLV